jgi:hypothetical protein
MQIRFYYVDPNSVVSNSISIGGTFTNTNAEVI